MRTKSVLAVLLACSLTFLSGCWDYVEFEDLAMISALGFDTDGSNHQVTVTAVYLVSGGSSQQGSEGKGQKSASGTTVVKATGRSASEALEKIQLAVEKKLFFSYTEAVVVGEAAAKGIMMDIIGMIDRTPKMRTSVYVAVTKGLAETVLSSSDPNTSSPIGKSLRKLIEQSRSSGCAYPVTVQEFLEELSISGQEPSVPKVTTELLEQSQTDGSSGSSINNVDEGPVEIGKSKKGYSKIDGIAVFQGGNLAGFLSERQSKGLAYITSQKITPYETVSTSSEGEVQGTIVFRITKSKSKIKVRVENGRPVADIDVYVEAQMRKYSFNIKEETLTPDVIKMLETSICKNVRADIDDAIQKIQKELKVDAFCIGFNLYRQHPKLWHSEYEKKWDEVFPSMQINVKVKAKLIATGTNIKKVTEK